MVALCILAAVLFCYNTMVLNAAIALISAGLLALAFMGFSGLKIF